MANEKQLSELRQNIIIALADNRMNLSKTARQMYMSRNAAVYHLEQIKKITGKDPLDFYQLYDLALCVKAERIKGDLDG